MSNLPSNWGFSSGSTSKGSLAGDSPSKEEEEEMSFISTAEPAQWTQRPNANESSSFSDIFQILSDIHLQEPSSPLMATTSDNIPTTKNNLGASEQHGEPSNSTRKRRVEELELRKCLSEGNEQLSTDMKIREDQKPRKTRSAETHNMAERRRRGRIKEKIRSLQHLMPYCEKRDCASILDEAVEYLKTLKAQSQMMSMSMGTVNYNPYTSATGIANMPITQYSPYAPFRPGMGLVPFPSPTLTPSGILPLVQSSMELHPSLPISGTSILPSVQPTYTVGPPLLLDNRSKKGPVFKELEMVASQEASTSGQISSKSSPGSIVHATHIVPSSTEGQETNL